MTRVDNHPALPGIRLEARAIETDPEWTNAWKGAGLHEYESGHVVPRIDERMSAIVVRALKRDEHAPDPDGEQMMGRVLRLLEHRDERAAIGILETGGGAIDSNAIPEQIFPHLYKSWLTTQGVLNTRWWGVVKDDASLTSGSGAEARQLKMIPVAAKVWEAVCKSATDTAKEGGQILTPLLAHALSMAIHARDSVVAERGSTKTWVENKWDGEAPSLGPGMDEAHKRLETWIESQPVGRLAGIMDLCFRGLWTTILKNTKAVKTEADILLLEPIIDSWRINTLTENKHLGEDAAKTVVEFALEMLKTDSTPWARGFFEAMRQKGATLTGERMRSLRVRAIMGAAKNGRTLDTLADIDDTAMDPVIRAVLKRNLNGHGARIAALMRTASGQEWLDLVRVATSDANMKTVAVAEKVREALGTTTKAQLEGLRRSDLMFLIKSGNQEKRNMGLSLSMLVPDELKTGENTGIRRP